MNRAIRATGRFANLVRVGLIAGIVVAAVAFPLAALGGIAVQTGVNSFEDLPHDPRITPAAQTSYVYAADGRTLLTTFYEEHRKYLPLSATSPWIQEAVIAAEDGRFFEHKGVDIRGIARAFVANQRSGEVAQGASTLTMQYVRAALRDSAQTPQEAIAATEQTSARKIREMRLAVEIERRMTKAQILEAYLNVAYFGHRAYGIYAGAEVFFSKKASQLNLLEAATLAGLVKAPSAYDPASTDKRAATERRNYVIDRMTDLGYISPQTADVAKRTPIKLRLTNPPNDCVSINPSHNDMGFFCDLFKQWWIQQPAFGSTPADRLAKLRRGGWTITTSIDPKLQGIAMKRVLEKEPMGSRFAHGVVAVQPGTGEVRAMAVNRVYSLDQSHNGRHSNSSIAAQGVRGNYPNTVNMLLGGGNVNGYQAGSTFKLFTLLAALEQGRPLQTKIYAPQRIVTKYLAGYGEPGSCGGRWCPQNASAGMTGTQTMWSGFGKSVNTYFVQLEERVGAANAVRMAERLGLTWHTDIDRLQATKKANTWGAFTLGVADTTPLEMANAYATVAAEGRYCTPLPVVSIKDPLGHQAMWTPPGGTKQVPVASPRCHQAVSVEAARGATDAARCVTGYGATSGSCGGWSTAPGVYGAVGRPVAGKTGTTDETRAAWFVGFTPDLAAASFVADPDNPFHVAGDWNSWKPVQSVSQVLHDGLEGTPIHYFHPPSKRTVRGR
jgi:membrane peptidoglycan carboxypeptidase